MVMEEKKSNELEGGDANIANLFVDGRISVDEEIEPNHKIINKHYINSINADLEIRQLPSQGLSFQIWPAASALISFLGRHSTDFSFPSTSHKQRSSSHLHLRILELGSGTGIVGISAAATLSANVTLTDLPSVIPNLRFNIQANSQLLSACRGSASASTLRWGCGGDVEAIGSDFDLILASDVVYHVDLFDPLLKTLKRLMDAEKKPFLLMAHLRRWKKDSCFFKKARRLFDVVRSHEDPPLPGSRVGVVVYRFSGRFDVHYHECGPVI